MCLNAIDFFLKNASNYLFKKMSPKTECVIKDGCDHFWGIIVCSAAKGSQDKNPASIVYAYFEQRHDFIKYLFTNSNCYIFWIT